jgi:hypothetical protein
LFIIFNFNIFFQDPKKRPTVDGIICDPAITTFFVDEMLKREVELSNLKTEQQKFDEKIENTKNALEQKIAEQNELKALFQTQQKKINEMKDSFEDN